MYFCPRERPRRAQRTLRDSRRHSTTINPAMVRLQCVPDGWLQPPLLSPEHCWHPRFGTPLPPDHGGGGSPGRSRHERGVKPACPSPNLVSSNLHRPSKKLISMNHQCKTQQKPLRKPASTRLPPFSPTRIQFSSNRTVIIIY